LIKSVHPLSEISEVSMFKGSYSIPRFKESEVPASLPSNTFLVIGKSEERIIKQLLPDIITHLEPKQLGALRDLTNGDKKAEEVKEETRMRKKKPLIW
jgi:nascent polypeptide-associated complex subunit beta